jgi:hypothetical protein
MFTLTLHLIVTALYRFIIFTNKPLVTKMRQIGMLLGILLGHLLVVTQWQGSIK